MKKKLLLVSLILSFTSISYGNNFADLGNIYEKIQNQEIEKINKYYSKGIQETAALYGISASHVKGILAGKLTLCVPIFDKLGIKPINNEYTFEQFLLCGKKIEQAVDNYVSTKKFNDVLKDNTKGKNILSDGDTANAPYDLLADIKTISKLLFKKAITIKTDFEQDKDKKGNENNDSSETTSTNLSNPSNPTNTNGNDSQANNEDTETPSTNPSNPNNPDSPGNDNGNNTENQELATNTINGNDFQIGNICDTNTNGNNNNGNGNNNGGGGRNGSGNAGGDDGKFDTFKGGGDAASKFHIGSYDNNGGYINGALFGSGGKINIGANPEANSEYCPPEDYILAICVRLIPAGPRGPVGGDVKVTSIEEESDKIGDSLRDIRTNQVTLAGHGDESLDIDFKHVDLTKHFHFNIILDPKPVWGTHTRPQEDKERNLPDTEVENIPRKLGVLYKKAGIADVFDKDNDKNKYLLTNKDFVNKSLGIVAEEKVDASHSTVTYSEMDKYEEFVMNMDKTVDSFRKLTDELKEASLTVKERSEE